MSVALAINAVLLLAILYMLVRIHGQLQATTRTIITLYNATADGKTKPRAHIKASS